MFDYLLSSLGNPIKTFLWREIQHVCWRGGGKKGGGKIRIFAGFLC